MRLFLAGVERNGKNLGRLSGARIIAQRQRFEEN